MDTLTREANFLLHLSTGVCSNNSFPSEKTLFQCIGNQTGSHKKLSHFENMVERSPSVSVHLKVSGHVFWLQMTPASYCFSKRNYFQK